MNIAFLVTRADPIGGAQIHVRDLAAAVRREGHSPTVLLSGSGPFVDDLRARGIPVVILRHLVNPIRPYQDVRAFWTGLRQAVQTTLYGGSETPVRGMAVRNEPIEGHDSSPAVGTCCDDRLCMLPAHRKRRETVSSSASRA